MRDRPVVLNSMDVWLNEIQSAWTPAPDPSPQGGGEKGTLRRRPSTRSPNLYFASAGSGGTLSLGAEACMVIRVIDTRS